MVALPWFACSRSLPLPTRSHHERSLPAAALHPSLLQLGGAELRHAQLSFDSDPCGSGGAGMLWVLRVQPASSSGSTIPSLGDLLNALLPPGAPLHCLRLGGGAGLQAGAARGCRRLARLPALRLDACPSAGSEAEAGVRALLAQAATLAALRIDGSSGAEEDQGQGWIPLTDVPAWLAATQGLAALSLTCHHLATLPEGPYLSGEGPSGRAPPGGRAWQTLRWWSLQRASELYALCSAPASLHL